MRILYGYIYYVILYFKSTALVFSPFWTSKDTHPLIPTHVMPDVPSSVVETDTVQINMMVDSSTADSEWSDFTTGPLCGTYWCIKHCGLLQECYALTEPLFIALAYVAIPFLLFGRSGLLAYPLLAGILFSLPLCSYVVGLIKIKLHKN